ncbi:MAG: AAA family ATPase [Pseudanabaena sp. RU_4_16]|mgnify:FL=1|nr:AAA family ATPase [Pseudanabaena sp. RU_4_16]NKB18757.1 AAA family ATPase [Pseudanabaena sp. CRU_2_10]
MPAAILLIGVPGSGKSKLAMEMLRSQRTGTPASTQLISPDLIRQKLYGSASIQGAWGQIWAEVQQEFTNAAASKHSIIYDATNYKREYRQEVIALARQHGFEPVTGLWLDVPLWLCLIRNQHRDRPVPDEIVIEMHTCLSRTPPHLSEGFDSLMFKQENKESEWID